ncbi:androgen-dependent TFPI-regulating protein [Hyalella azteca]|uniref:Androgen-dependent TFPI-regulating protein n=1 Tax=Hyalella azteca TaxID=294128 RepID=A0A8B7NB35_HYAAZ|nr:androgen-dependent TFPI-regulating protein [Hyalella azteca]
MQNLFTLFFQAAFVIVYAIGICCFYLSHPKVSPKQGAVEQTSVYYPIKSPLLLNAVLHLSYLTARLLRNCNIASGTLLRCVPSHELLSKVFTLIVFPSALSLFLPFWIKYSLCREFIYPEVFDAIISDFKFHSVHTVPLVAVAAEVTLVPRSFPPKWIGFSSCAAVFHAYLAWALARAFSSHNFFSHEVQSMTGRRLALLLLLLTLILWCSYTIGRGVNSVMAGLRKTTLDSIVFGTPAVSAERSR